MSTRDHGDTLVRIYLYRLIKLLVPPELGDQHADTLFEEFTDRINRPSSQRYQIHPCIEEFKAHVPGQAAGQIIENLLSVRDAPTVARYLKTLLELDEPMRPVSTYAPTMDSFENTHMDRYSDRRSMHSTTILGDLRGASLEEVLAPYMEGQVSEADLLACLPYTMVGTTSNLLPVKDGKVLIPNNLSNGLSGALHITLEAGVIYQDLSRRLEKGKTQVHVALMSFISDELSTYVQLVNDLSTQQYTLKSVYADLLDSLVRLRFLHHILYKSTDVSSSGLLSLVHSFTRHGDPVILSTAEGMLDYILEPFLIVLSKWIINGEISGDEFFISSQSGMEGLRFHDERVPKFISLNLAKMIYSVGMTNVFLKVYCKETRWTSEFSQRTEFKFRQVRLGKNNFLNDSKFHTFVTNVHDEIMNFLTDTLHNKLHLMKVLNALCDYLLMSKGDFIESLILTGTELLNEPSSSLTGHQLMRLLQNSVLQTTSRFDLNQSDNNLIINNLDARLLAIGHGNVGWDVFTLDYRIEPSLNLLLNDKENQHKKEYLRIFNHMWKIRRLDHELTQGWIQSKRTRVKSRKLTRIRLIHNFVQGFIKTIQSHISYEIVDKSYLELKKEFEPSETKHSLKVEYTGSSLKIHSGTLKPNTSYLKRINGINETFTRMEHGVREIDIDDIQEIHSKFLSSITGHKLFNGATSTSRGKLSNKFYISQLNSLINVAFKFVLSENEFNKMVVDQSRGDDSQKRMDTVYDNLLLLFNEFNADLKQFVDDLSHDDDLKLRYLGVSLNQ